MEGELSWVSAACFITNVVRAEGWKPSGNLPGNKISVSGVATARNGRPDSTKTRLFTLIHKLGHPWLTIYSAFKVGAAWVDCLS